MAVMGILFPAVLHFTHTEVHFGKSELALSRFSSCIMLLAYASYLLFQLKSHPSLYTPIDEEIENSVEVSIAEDEEVPEISLWAAICWLAILTVWISILSGYLVDAIQGASESLNMPVAFISVILLPIVGNAAEHASAIMFAMKDKLDISLGVAIGSSTQISMFVIPFCVVVGWMMEKPMDLNFQLFETATLFITVLVVTFMLQEGTSNYFKGLMLIFCYLIVAASFFVHIDPKTSKFINQVLMISCGMPTTEFKMKAKLQGSSVYISSSRTPLKTPTVLKKLPVNSCRERWRERVRFLCKFGTGLYVRNFLFNYQENLNMFQFNFNMNVIFSCF
ncbi:Vacuolar cation/proton exchanger 5 [Nymphaea thermarum]|nr:Vacuolar cation/proton exchanger 5 [Nymphaea thermarum]